MKLPGKKGEDLFAWLADTLRKAGRNESRKVRLIVFRCLHAAVLTFGNFQKHGCLSRASALSYTTLLSLVPFLALAFAVLKGFGVQNTLEPIIVEKLAAGSGDAVGKIISYINNTKMATVGAIGLAALIMTVISLLGNIEEAFNDIWGVEETRTLYRKFSEYLSIVVSAPLLLLAAMSITTSLQSQNLVRWLIRTEYVGDFLLFCFQLLPYMSVWLAFFCLYVILPNTKVRIRSALVGGVIAGTIWQVAQWGYIHFQVGMAKYNAIYGTLAVLPIFMVWIYTSWVIVLFGAEVVVAHQYRRTFLYDGGEENLSHATLEKVALVLLMTVAESFYREETPWTVEKLANERHIPVRIVQRLFTQLVDAGYLVKAEGGVFYYPARDLEHIRISTFLNELKHLGGEYPIRDADVLGATVRELMARLDARTDQALGDLSLKDLVERLTAESEGKTE